MVKVSVEEEGENLFFSWSHLPLFKTPGENLEFLLLATSTELIKSTSHLLPRERT